MKNQISDLTKSSVKEQAYFIVPHEVRQLAKTDCPTLKPFANKAFKAGRQTKKKGRTHARTRKKIQNTVKQIHILDKKYQVDFMQVIPSLFQETDNTKVIFHNKDYVDTIHRNYKPFFANMFLSWVSTFAIMRSAYRKSPIEGVILSDDSDFLTAFQLMKLQGMKPISRPVNSRKIVWDIIEQYYPEAEFKGTDISKKTLMSSNQVIVVLKELAAKGKLTKTKKRGFTSHFYQIIKQD